MTDSDPAHYTKNTKGMSQYEQMVLQSLNVLIAQMDVLISVFGPLPTGEETPPGETEDDPEEEEAVERVREDFNISFNGGPGR